MKIARELQSLRSKKLSEMRKNHKNVEGVEKIARKQFKANVALKIRLRSFIRHREKASI